MERPNFYVPVKIGTFNIQKLEGNIEKVSNVLSQFDICGLQEVPGWERLKCVTPVGYSALFDDAYPTYGNGLICKNELFTADHFKTHILKHAPGKKTAFEVCLNFKRGGSLTVFIVHLDHKDENARIKQIQTLEKILPSSPHLILGDFNSLTFEDYTDEDFAKIEKSRKDSGWERPKNNVTTKMKEIGYLDVLAEVPNGISATCRFDTRIDYIYLYDSNLDFGFGEVINADIPGASDHKPVGIVLMIPT